MKYIIKNCPNCWHINRVIPICGVTHKVCGFKGETEVSRYCKDIDNCVLKQIVEKCKEATKYCDECPHWCCIDCCFNTNGFAQEILDMFEIEEIKE
jgi:hypothetical protein